MLEINASDSCLPYTLDLRNDIVFVTVRNLKNLESILADAYIIGIDTETRPSFYNRKTRFGRYPTSIIQIAVRKKSEEEFVAILDLLNISVDGKAMNDLNRILLNCLSDDNVVKVGQGLMNDLSEICTAYPTLSSFRDVSSIMDTNVLYRHLQPEIKQDISLKNLALNYLHCDLIKTEQCSDWARRPLSSSQIKYAAGDALILLRLFDAMTCEAAERDGFNLSLLLKKFQYGVSSKRVIKPVMMNLSGPVVTLQIDSHDMKSVHTRFDENALSSDMLICPADLYGNFLNTEETLDMELVLNEECCVGTESSGAISGSSSCTSLSSDIDSISDSTVSEMSSAMWPMAKAKKVSVNRKSVKLLSKYAKPKRNDIWRPLHTLFSKKSTFPPFVPCPLPSSLKSVLCK
jgi:3'-5' exonuclease